MRHENKYFKFEMEFFDIRKKKKQISMISNVIVQQEINRIYNHDDSDNYDVPNLVVLLGKIEMWYNDDRVEHLLIDTNMWQELHESLDRIMDEFNLEYDCSISDFAEYKGYIRKKVK